MKVIESPLLGVVVVEPEVFGDARGYFLETFHAEKYREIGITESFVQDNHSFSRAGTLRGLHAQYRRPQGKLVRAVEGEVFDVVVDMRPGSPTYRQWFAEVLSGENHRQMYVPTGCLHGFCVLSESVHFQYKCTDFYDAAGEITVRWDDETIGVEWPVAQPIISAKDARGLAFEAAEAFLRDNAAAWG